MQLNNLTEEEKRVIVDKGTEMPFVGEYVNNTKYGVYVCRQIDKDGVRTEITCANCGGHWGIYSKASK